MKERLLVYAIAASIAVHLCAVVLVGRTSAGRLASAPPAVTKRNSIDLEMIDLPRNEAPKPEQMVEVSRPPAPKPPPPDEPDPTPTSGRRWFGAPKAPVHTAPPGRTPQASGNPGGRINIGSTSTGGDLTGVQGGQTSSGTVPNNSGGDGDGSGTHSGVGSQDPPQNPVEGPGTTVQVPLPPPPTLVDVKICSESGMLFGPNCKRGSTKSFVEGHQPSRKCAECQPEHVNRLADREEPELIKDCPRPAIPTSVEEGLTLQVKYRYTITAEGGVSDVEITKSSGNKTLDRNVANAVSQKKFRPAIQNGVPRSVSATGSFTFKT